MDDLSKLGAFALLGDADPVPQSLFLTHPEQAKTLMLLYEVSRELTSILDREELLRRVAERVKKIVNYHVFVARQVIPRAENADRCREPRAMLHVREQEGVRRPRVMRIVNDEVGLGDAIAERNHFDVAIGFPADTLIAVLPENQRLAMFQLDDMLAARIFFGYGEPRAVIEDVAILQNLDECGTLMRRGVFQSVFQVRLEDVD